MKYPFVKST